MTDIESQLPIVNYKDFPKRVRVKGLPFMLQGWNNTYTRTKNIVNGSPTYKLESYVLYMIIPIIGVELRRNEDGTWSLHRECDYERWSFIKSVKLIDPKYPYGSWSDNMKVEPII